MEPLIGGSRPGDGPGLRDGSGTRWRDRLGDGPSGGPLPCAHPLQTTGLGWLTASVVLVALSLLVFSGDLHGAAVTVTVLDDAVVRWLADLDAPGLRGAMEVLAAPASWVAITALLWSLLLALLVLRRLRHLLVVLFAWTLQGFVIQYVLAPLHATAAPVRGGAQDRLVGVGDAVRADGGAGGGAGGDHLRARARRSLAPGRQVGGRRVGGPRRRRPHAPRSGRADRRRCWAS